MKKILLLSLALMLGSSVHAEGSASCAAQAAEKKLAGAAKASFTKKCEADAAAKCDAAAAEKKLAGAAKTSFTKKCVAEAVGSTP